LASFIFLGFFLLIAVGLDDVLPPSPENKKDDYEFR